jgi:hypothetical protein
MQYYDTTKLFLILCEFSVMPFSTYFKLFRKYLSGECKLFQYSVSKKRKPTDLLTGTKRGKPRAFSSSHIQTLELTGLCLQIIYKP